MKRPRRKFSAQFKAIVALEAISGRETLWELPARFEVSPVVHLSLEKAVTGENVHGI